MSDLLTCEACGGFVRGDARACPHCEAASPRQPASRSVVALVVGAVASAGFAFTLMACYGGPPVPEDSGNRTDVQNTDASDAATAEDVAPDAPAAD